ncbi:hypothetical protein LY76DRAFT_366779 [Colletotrichum caudatum]|nr:hypothetical protein LY76DRAFT_366779 [Colletotrichum caudatum]
MTQAEIRSLDLFAARKLRLSFLSIPFPLFLFILFTLFLATLRCFLHLLQLFVRGNSHAVSHSRLREPNYLNRSKLWISLNWVTVGEEITDSSSHKRLSTYIRALCIGVSCNSDCKEDNAIVMLGPASADGGERIYILFNRLMLVRSTSRQKPNASCSH